ncbi:MAG: hypothetical protein K0R84_1313 [Clostridia bacterium]|jgi:hypothetical protein|nr:hypothetical protein [Clostridia bacterium]
MRRIAVYAAGTISAGEITIASRFASQLSPEHYHVTYIIPRHYEKILPPSTDKLLLDPVDGAGINKRRILGFLNEYRPDFILLADPYTCHHASSWTGLSFDAVKAAGIPTIGLDEYNYRSTRASVDYYGGIKTRCRDLLSECDFSIQDVPVNLIEQKGENIWKFSLFDNNEILRFLEEDKEKLKRQIKADLKMKQDEKLVFLAVSSWEHANMHRLPVLDGFIVNLSRLLLHYLEEVSPDCTFIHVGQEALEPLEDSRIKYIHHTGIPSEEYNRLIDASDLFITFNLVSVTLSRAVLRETPAIVFQNDKIIDFSALQDTVKRMPDWYQHITKGIKIAYPFKASVFGWCSFLKPLLEKNSYFDLFSQVPVFSYSKAKKAIETVLYDEAYNRQYRDKLKLYLRQLEEIQSPDEIMDCMVKNIKSMKG